RVLLLRHPHLDHPQSPFPIVLLDPHGVEIMTVKPIKNLAGAIIGQPIRPDHARNHVTLNPPVRRIERVRISHHFELWGRNLPELPPGPPKGEGRPRVGKPHSLIDDTRPKEPPGKLPRVAADNVVKRLHIVRKPLTAARLGLTADTPQRRG